MTTSTLRLSGAVLLGICLFALPMAQATSPHTITIDGTNDFATDEDVAGNSGATWFFTWDANNFYFALDASDVNSGSATRFLHLYLDTDPETDITTGTGSTLGVIYNTQEPTLPFTANYHFRWRADNAFTNVLQFESGSWNDAGLTIGAGQDMEVFQSGTYVEVRIARSALGSPPAVYASGAMINEQGGGEFTFFMTPAGVNSDGYDADYSGYFGFPLINGISPDDGSFINTPLPVEWLTVAADQAGAGAVMLNWATARESENAGFTPQIMLPGQRTFIDQGWVDAGDRPEQSQGYSWTFQDLAPGAYTFRVKQTDIDGRFSYSPQVALYVSPWQDIRVQKVGTVLELNLSVVEAIPLHIQVYDMAGRVQAQQKVEVQSAGLQSVSLPLSLVPGIYVYEVRIAGKPYRGQFRW